MEYSRSKVVEQCEGCAKIHMVDSTCVAYLIPASKWRAGRCPMATHIVKSGSTKSKIINPLKASKRSMEGV